MHYSCRPLPWWASTARRALASDGGASPALPASSGMILALANSPASTAPIEIAQHRQHLELTHDRPIDFQTHSYDVRPLKKESTNLFRHTTSLYQTHPDLGQKMTLPKSSPAANLREHLLLRYCIRHSRPRYQLLQAERIQFDVRAWRNHPQDCTKRWWEYPRLPRGDGCGTAAHLNARTADTHECPSFMMIRFPHGRRRTRNICRCCLCVLYVVRWVFLVAPLTFSCACTSRHLRRLHLKS